jgi:hypothetical protein
MEGFGTHLEKSSGDPVVRAHVQLQLQYSLEISVVSFLLYFAINQAGIGFLIILTTASESFRNGTFGSSTSKACVRISAPLKSKMQIRVERCD